MLSARAARWRLSLGCLLALTPATALAVTATASPASADSVRNAEQWVLNAVDAPAAWPVSQGQGVVVAVIDSTGHIRGSVIWDNVPDYTTDSLVGACPTIDNCSGSVIGGFPVSGAPVTFTMIRNEP